MPKIHISLKVDTYDLLKQKAKSINYSVQDFVERSIELAVREPLALFSASTEYINNGKKENSLFTFIDLFAGIGGMRTAFETAGGQCVFSSEWDKYCQRTYYENFGDIPHGDITEIKPELIPIMISSLQDFPVNLFQ